MTLLNKWRRARSRPENGKGSPRAVEPMRRGETGLQSLRGGIDRAFERVRRELDQGRWPLMGRELSGGPPWGGLLENWPAIDMAEDDKELTLRIDVPGMDPKDIDVEVSGHTLTLRGTREDEWEDKSKGVHRRERVSGRFMRSITLPEYVDAQKVAAHYDRGTLTLKAPKIAGRAPRRISIS